AEIANAQALRGHVPDALGVRAIAMRSQRVRRAVATSTAAHVADEGAGGDRSGRRSRRAEEHRLRSVELEWNRKIVPLRADAPAAAGDLDNELGRLSRHARLVVQRLCATVPHAWHVRF